MLISAVKQSYSVIDVYIYAYTCTSFFYILFHYGLFQDIAGSSLGYTVGACCLSILHMSVYKCFVFNIHKIPVRNYCYKILHIRNLVIRCLDNVLTVTQIKD